MSFAAKILADSLSPDGVRLTTFEVTLPRIILSEFNTHRMFSRNSASSRAIPVEKMIKMVQENPYIPSLWGSNQKGMQAGAELSEFNRFEAKMKWIDASVLAVNSAKALQRLGVHKQLTNRLLEPFMWHTCIVTATEWSNFFHLRNNAQAHPDIQTIARMMQELYESSVPIELRYGEWHQPLTDIDTGSEVFARFPDNPIEVLNKISVARCARVSYLTHDGKRDLQADLDLHDKLLTSGHLSPFEHVARPLGVDEYKGNESATYLRREVAQFDGQPCGVWSIWSGNLRGWLSARKLIPNEADILGTPR